MNAERSELEESGALALDQAAAAGGLSKAAGGLAVAPGGQHSEGMARN